MILNNIIKSILLLSILATIFSSNLDAKDSNILAYKDRGIKYYPKYVRKGHTKIGKASWYGNPFHGRLTANGERYNMYGMTAAHRTYAMGTRLKVTNLRNKRSVTVRVNDRGPFYSSRNIDLSYGAAKKLGMLQKGVGRVKIKVLSSPGKKSSKKYKKSYKKTSKKFKKRFVQKKNKIKKNRSKVNKAKVKKRLLAQKKKVYKKKVSKKISKKYVIKQTKKKVLIAKVKKPKKTYNKKTYKKISKVSPKRVHKVQLASFVTKKYAKSFQKKHKLKNSKIIKQYVKSKKKTTYRVVISCTPWEATKLLKSKKFSGSLLVS